MPNAGLGSAMVDDLGGGVGGSTCWLSTPAADPAVTCDEQFAVSHSEGIVRKHNSV